ncbi:hypothetical protein BDR03DRAFT_973641 [Suillus americanus]|nr:hypothetical protein BDR03DRAFT_973641 [Suillus americanus]
MSGTNGAEDQIPALDKITLLLGTLSLFNPLVGTIPEIHPYAKAAWGVLLVCQQTITSQATYDDSINQLLQKMEDVYIFLIQNDLATITLMKSVVARICQQTIECAYFLRDYSKSMDFWIKLGRDVVSESNNTVKRYNAVFDNLIQQFQDRQRKTRQ